VMRIEHPGARAELLACPSDGSVAEVPTSAGQTRWHFVVGGALPEQDVLPCPLEGYPEILAGFDGHDFGLAIKLGGRRCAGELELLQAMHAFWLAPYGEHAYRHGGVAFDPVRRSALFWVDRLDVPVGARECVHHLLWVVARLAEVVPIEHARFAVAEPAMKYGALLGDDGPPFVLAGNPLAHRLQADGEAAAFAWAEQQRQWDARELAAMLAEIVVEQDPGRSDSAAVALRLCERGLAIEPGHADLAGYRLQILVAQDRVAEAVEHARPDPVALAHLVGLVGEQAPGALPLVCDALDDPALAVIAATDLVQPLVAEIGLHAPERLPGILARLPRDSLVEGR